MTINKTQAERLIFLVNLQAKNFGEMERNLIAIARTLECLFDSDTDRSGTETLVNAPLSQGSYTSRFMDPHNPNIALKSNPEALAGISGTTLSVDTAPTLVKRWEDGKELWKEKIADTGLCIFADNRYMVKHPSDATEELLERLQEDHGV